MFAIQPINYNRIHQNDTMTPITIPLSKKKILLLTLGSFGFVFLGILFLIMPEKFVSSIARSETFIWVVGIVSILFFGATGIYGCLKLRDHKIGLTLNEEGIIDHTNATSIGLIAWHTISDIKPLEIASTKLLLIYTTNQEEILNNVTGWKRKLMAANAKMYGTPLSITASTLACDANELEELIMSTFTSFKEGKLTQ